MRDLKNNLSRYLDLVAGGTEIIVTERGKPVAKLTSLEQERDPLQELIDEGLVRPPIRPDRTLPKRIKLKGGGMISDIVAEQRG